MNPFVSLKESEKILVVFFSFLLLTFFAISHLRHRSTSLEIEKKIASLKAHPLRAKKCMVTIEGAVLNPGSFSVNAGISLAKILHKAKVLPHANLRHLDLQMPIQEDLFLFLEELDQIEVRVKGAVIQEEVLVLNPKATINDLKGKIALKPSADLRFFRKRKKIFDRSIVEIPEIAEKACD